MKTQFKGGCSIPAQARKGSRLDCYEFYLWSMGELDRDDEENEDVWDYIEGREKGRNENGNKIV